MIKRGIVLIAIIISGCTPVNIQSWFVTKSPSGGLIHHYTGYTNNGETRPGSGRQYLKQALSQQCGSEGRIDRIDEWPAHNAISDFMYWAGEGECIK